MAETNTEVPVPDETDARAVLERLLAYLAEHEKAARRRARESWSARLAERDEVRAGVYADVHGYVGAALDMLDHALDIGQGQKVESGS